MSRVTEQVEVRVYTTDGKIIDQRPLNVYREDLPDRKGSAWYRMGPPREITVLAKKTFTFDHVSVTTPKAFRALGVDEVCLPEAASRVTTQKGDTLTIKIPECVYTFKDRNRR